MTNSALDKAYIRSILKRAKVKVYPMKSSIRGNRICKICGKDFADTLRGIEQYIDHYNEKHRACQNNKHPWVTITRDTYNYKQCSECGKVEKLPKKKVIA